MLHVTNGDAAADGIRRGLQGAGIEGEVLPWRDVLHDGPVPPEPPEALAVHRARFLASCGFASQEGILADLRRRNATLEAAITGGAEIVLWFEHDLYDQLQLIEILPRLAGRAASCSMICIDRYPGIEPFHGLGQLGPEQLAGLYPGKRTLGAAGFDHAARGWAAFTSEDPRALAELASEKNPPLSFLPAALARFCRAYPDVEAGIDLTERFTLEGLASGIDTAAGLFRHQQEVEEHPFLGDAGYWCVLRDLAAGVDPVIEIEHATHQAFAGATVRLTATGHRVLAGEADRIELNGLDRWRGGVHLEAPDPWRWDPREQRFRPSGEGLV
ncbi:hypothetical protein ABI59_11760 [Acidobacteria bacterium Mor1]|nr:hypothetical protein ABI59_11760 [Acidobacteria bacterium Mor1]